MFEMKNYMNLLERSKSLADRLQKYCDEKEEIEKLKEVLQEPFILMFAGEFNTGKTTFLNSLFELNLRVDVLPTTEKIILIKNKGKTQKLNKILNSHYIYALECKKEDLPPIYWVDSPGLKSLKKELSEITNSFVKYADFVAVFTRASQPMTGLIKEFIKNLKNKDFAVIVNKIDEVKEEAKMEFLQFFANFKKNLGMEFPVFFTSGKNKIDGGFLEYLEHFLEQKGSQTHLKTFINNIEKLADKTFKKIEEKLKESEKEAERVKRVKSALEKRMHLLQNMLEGVLIEVKSIIKEGKINFERELEINENLYPEEWLQNFETKFSERIKEVVKKFCILQNIDIMPIEIETKEEEGKLPVPVISKIEEIFENLPEEWKEKINQKVEEILDSISEKLAEKLVKKFSKKSSGQKIRSEEMDKIKNWKIFFKRVFKYAGQILKNVLKEVEKRSIKNKVNEILDTLCEETQEAIKEHLQEAINKYIQQINAKIDANKYQKELENVKRKYEEILEIKEEIKRIKEEIKC